MKNYWENVVTIAASVQVLSWENALDALKETKMAFAMRGTA